MYCNKIRYTVIILVLILGSCKKEQVNYTPADLSVTFPILELQHNAYYRMDPGDRAIGMVFDGPVDQASVAASLEFSDKTGIITAYELMISGSMVYLDFRDDFRLREGWRYFLTIGPGITSLDGERRFGGQKIEIRTTGMEAGLFLGLNGGDTSRNTIVVMSDLHLCNATAAEGHYSMFTANAEAMEHFLDQILTGGEVREVIIQGDIFDEWMVPFRESPFDSSQGITDTREFFLSVAANPINQPSIEKFREIARHPGINLIYIPGNHDMLLTREVLEEIIPGIQWAGDVPGLGKYIPVNGILMEHGHRYDFFNCPQPLVNPPHLLPPGYFITRFYAGCVSQAGSNGSVYPVMKSSWQFDAAWVLCFLELVNQYHVAVPPMDSTIVLMSGIDGYTTPFSFNGAHQMYTSCIENLWQNTQQTNGVPVPISVFVALLNSIDVGAMAYYEYLNQSPGLNTYKIVSFGHTHNPDLIVYPAGSHYTKLYANSGSWVDQDKCSRKVRTFLTIQPSQWTGSDLHVVKLYQYNKSSGGQVSDSTWVADLLAEENIPAN